jgi:hypothetical protein
VQEIWMEAGLLSIINDLLERLDDFIFLFFDLMELLSLNQLNTFFIALGVYGRGGMINNGKRSKLD